MIEASLTFTRTLRATLKGKEQPPQKTTITVDISTDAEEPLTVEVAKEILVQIAIAITNPKELDRLAQDLAAFPSPRRRRLIRVK